MITCTLHNCLLPVAEKLPLDRARIKVYSGHRNRSKAAIQLVKPRLILSHHSIWSFFAAVPPPSFMLEENRSTGRMGNYKNFDLLSEKFEDQDQKSGTEIMVWKAALVRSLCHASKKCASYNRHHSALETCRQIPHIHCKQTPVSIQNLWALLWQENFKSSET